MSKEMEKRVYEVMTQRTLCCFVDKNKWKILETAMMYEMPFPPYFVFKTLFDKKCRNEMLIYDDRPLVGDWEGAYFSEEFCSGAVEWIKIRPRYLHNNSLVVPPNLIDAHKKLEEILFKYDFQYTKKEFVYTIYAYR